jgi:hypothetical protein
LGAGQSEIILNILGAARRRSGQCHYHNGMACPHHKANQRKQMPFCPTGPKRVDDVHYFH